MMDTHRIRGDPLAAVVAPFVTVTYYLRSMIKLNNESQRIHDIMTKRFGLSKDTSMKALIMRISILWRDADSTLHDKECSRFVYSRLELVLADIILLCIAILRRIGVRNIENLIRRRIEDSDPNNKLRK